MSETTCEVFGTKDDVRPFVVRIEDPELEGTVSRSAHLGRKAYSRLLALIEQGCTPPTTVSPSPEAAEAGGGE